LATHKLSNRQFRLLGILPLLFFTAQAIHYWQINELGHMLWMCNIGNLLLAVGLFLEEATLIRVAVIWMVPGLVVWCLYVVPTWGMLLTGKFTYSQLYGVLSSTLAHLGGFSMGAVAVRRVGMNGHAWFYAFVWYLAIQLLSRMVTPVALNVNLSQRVQEGWEQTFTTYWKFWLVLTLLVGIGLWILGLLLKVLLPFSPAPKVAFGADAQDCMKC
jgi:hypothetical protein